MKQIGLPKGYKRIMWIDVYETQVVWLRGSSLGKSIAYGPHTVVDKARKCLRNKRGSNFLHYPEELLVKKDEKLCNIIGIDPGKTIGLCLYQNSVFMKGREASNISYVLQFIQENSPDCVVIEDFHISRRPSMAKLPIGQIAVVEYYCAQHGISCILQNPSAMVYGKAREPKISKSSHISSACWHVMYYMEKNEN